MNDALGWKVWRTACTGPSPGHWPYTVVPALIPADQVAARWNPFSSPVGVNSRSTQLSVTLNEGPKLSTPPNFRVSVTVRVWVARLVVSLSSTRLVSGTAPVVSMTMTPSTRRPRDPLLPNRIWVEERKGRNPGSSSVPWRPMGREFTENE